MGSITADHRSLVLNGARELLISGAVHYPRSTPAMWPRILRESKRAGLNCIETYVFWEGHEPQEGLYDFTDRYNLGYFLDCCQAEGLYVMLRIGPYICAEWNFGGLPWWLVTKPGMVTRTENAPFKQAMSRWVHTLMDQIGDRQITHGGPIILAQMENEYNNIAKRYGEAGQRYLAWATELGLQAGLDVPLVMCEGASEDVIETLNGFSVWERAGEMRRARPQQPLLWTENWPGWYNIWGQPHHYRQPAEIAYEVLRFVAVGGSGVNYYMWHGGTNFARDAMYLQTTSYDFTAPIDEYGLPTTKSEHLGLMHAFLREHTDLLLDGERGPAEILQPGEQGDATDSVIAYPVIRGGETLTFLVNATHADQQARGVALPARSVAVLTGDTVGYRSWAEPKTSIVRAMTPAAVPLTWQSCPEPLPTDHTDVPRRWAPVTLPDNMLVATRDETDYGWYRTTVNSADEKWVTLSTSVEDILSVWVNGRYAGSTPTRLLEERPGRTACQVSLPLPLQAGTNELLLLVTAMGMIKGDWMIDAPQSEEKKGILAPVTLDGEEIAGPWRFTAGLWGEAVRLTEPGPSSQALWWEENADGAEALRGEPLTWYRTEFTLTADDMEDTAPWALEIGSLFKGWLWVNGHCLGRYWQQPCLPTKGYDWFTGHVLLEGIGAPPQRFYHIPADWLRAGDNTLVVFEERGARPGDARLVRRR